MDREMHDAAMGTDYFRIWNGLEKLLADNNLHWRADYARLQIRQVEGSSRWAESGQTEDASTQSAPTASAYALVLSQAMYHLGRSVGELEQAAASTSHLFRGKMRARTSGKIKRQISSTRELLDVFKAVGEELNAVDRPHKARYEVMHMMRLSFEDYLGVINPILAGLRGDKYCQPYTDKLQAQQVRLRSLRAQAIACCANPDQPMTDTIVDMVAQCQEIDFILKETARQTLQECLDHGLLVFKGKERMFKA